MFIVQSEQQEELLRFYETGVYEVVECAIVVEKRSVWGRTFRLAVGGRS